MNTFVNLCDYQNFIETDVNRIFKVFGGRGEMITTEPKAITFKSSKICLSISYEDFVKNYRECIASLTLQVEAYKRARGIELQCLMIYFSYENLSVPSIWHPQGIFIGKFKLIKSKKTFFRSLFQKALSRMSRCQENE